MLPVQCNARSNTFRLSLVQPAHHDAFQEYNTVRCIYVNWRVIIVPINLFVPYHRAYFGSPDGEVLRKRRTQQLLTLAEASTGMIRLGEGIRCIAFSFWAAIELEDLDECSTASPNDTYISRNRGLRCGHPMLICRTWSARRNIFPWTIHLSAVGVWQILKLAHPFSFHSN